MGRQGQTFSIEELDGIAGQCTALHEDWRRFYQLAKAAPEGDDGAQQLAFIQLQSRFSCDYPLLSHWRKANFGLAAGIGKLVANAGSLAAFATEARAGNGPLLREWHAVDDSITKVRRLLEEARQQAHAGKPVRLPKEIAAPKVREPWPVAAMARRTGTVLAILAGCALIFVVFQPVILETSLFRWLDKSYTAWQMRNGLPGAVPHGAPDAPPR